MHVDIVAIDDVGGLHQSSWRACLGSLVHMHMQTIDAIDDTLAATEGADGEDFILTIPAAAVKHAATIVATRSVSKEISFFSRRSKGLNRVTRNGEGSDFSSSEIDVAKV